MSKDTKLQTIFPFQNQALEKTTNLYHQSILPVATSYGKTIYHIDIYIEDIGCYAINEALEKVGFQCSEEFVENDILPLYYELEV